MKIVWDEPRRLLNLSKHGMDFAEVGTEFFDAATIRETHSGRRRAIGHLNGKLVAAVIYKPLGAEAVSLISLRPASIQERKLHDRF